MPELPETPSRSSLLRLILGLAGVVVILAGMQAAVGIVNLVLTGFLITRLALPVMRWLRTRGLKPRGAFLVTLLILLVVVVSVVGIGLISLASAASTVQTDLENFRAQTTALTANAGGTAQAAADGANSVAALVLGVVAVIGVRGIEFIVSAVFMLLIAVFMLAEADTFGTLLRRTVGADNPTYKNISESTSAVITYMTVTAILNALIAAGDVILLTLVGVPNPLLWGIVSFIFGFIPYIGYWISFLPPFILAFSVGGPTTAIIVLVGYALINGVFSQIVAPRMYGQSLNLSITLTLVTVLFWGWLLGPVGAILAVPMTAILKSGILASFPESAWLATILGNSRGKRGKDGGRATEDG